MADEDGRDKRNWEQIDKTLSADFIRNLVRLENVAFFRTMGFDLTSMNEENRLRDLLQFFSRRMVSIEARDRAIEYAQKLMDEHDDAAIRERWIDAKMESEKNYKSEIQKRIIALIFAIVVGIGGTILTTIWALHGSGK